MQSVFAVFWLKIDQIVRGNRIKLYEYYGSFVFFTIYTIKKKNTITNFNGSNPQITEWHCAWFGRLKSNPFIRSQFSCTKQYSDSNETKPPKKNRNRVSTIKETSRTKWSEWKVSFWYLNCFVENWNCLNKANIDTITLRKISTGKTKKKTIPFMHSSTCSISNVQEFFVSLHFRLRLLVLCSTFDLFSSFKPFIVSSLNRFDHCFICYCALCIVE